MKKKQKVIIAICLLIAVCCIGYMAYYYISQQNRNEVYEEIQEEVVIEPEPVVEVEEEPEPEPIEIPIDFAALKEINPDIYAWIEIPDTQIAYPVLQSTLDDEYYLNRTVDLQEGYPGSIFTQLSNGQDFEVFNTIFYGHNMSDDSMFGGLNLYRDLTYMEEHQYIYIYTEDAIRTYQVYLATTFSNEHLLYQYNFDDADECQRFLDETSEYKDMSKASRDDIEVTSDDRIITLSTCISGQKENRLLVQAVLVDEQK